MVHFEAKCRSSERAAAIQRMDVEVSEDRQQAGQREFAIPTARGNCVIA